MLHRRAMFMVAGPLLAVIALTAQSDADAPRFDVVSVVVNRSGTGGAGDNFPKSGTWRWKAIPLSFLVRYAYGVSLPQVIGVPDAFQGPQIAFDIVAKMPPDTSHERFRLMLQSLLADRFKARIHRETREIPVNTIEIARSGAKLQPASGDCFPAGRPGVVPDGQHRCGTIEHHVSVQDQQMSQEYLGRSISMADLSAELSANGPVIDDTGIHGVYDVDVHFQIPLQPPAEPGQPSDRETVYQQYFQAAFEKQLGLVINLGKLKKRPVPVLVIDHVELPTPN